jgi:hypothetical protein
VVQVPALASSAGRGFHTVRHAQCSTDGPTDQNRQGARLLLLSPVDFRSCILGYLAAFMKFPSLIAALSALTLGSCALFYSRSGTPFGPDDYAVALAQPYPSEARLAQERLHNFLSRANARDRQVLEETPYVAVQAYELTSGEVPWLPHKLGFGKVRAIRHYANDFVERTDVPVKFLVLFDHRSERLASPDGVLVIDTPSRGSIGQFGGFRAVYAGTGWW